MPQNLSKIEEKGMGLVAKLEAQILILHFPPTISIDKSHPLLVYNELRKSVRDKLYVILMSNGGDIPSAYEIAKLCRQFTELHVIVPLYAWSASTLLCLAADELLMLKIGKIGPIDPQITLQGSLISEIQPPREAHIPQRAIRDLADVYRHYIGSYEDDKGVAEAIVKPMFDKVNPFYLATHFYNDDTMEMYGLKILSQRGVEEKKARACIARLLSYPSHTYPIDYEEIENIPELREVISTKLIEDMGDEGLVNDIPELMMDLLTLNEPYIKLFSPLTK